MREPIRIMIADDHPIFRQGLKQIVESDEQMNVVAEAEDGARVLEQLQACAAQIALIDIDMPNHDGIEVARDIRANRLPVKIIFLTMHKDEGFLNLALDAGASGYVLKDGAIIEILSAIKAVAAGQTYISPALSHFLINRRRRAAELEQEHAGLQRLTATERRVLKLIAEYKTSREIANEMAIGIRTVEHHRANIAEKLGLRGSHALIQFASENKSAI